MKFISNATVVDYANQLDAVQTKIERLTQQIKAAREEEQGLITFLAKKMKNEPFTFTPIKGRYLKALEFNARSRKILNQALARQRLLGAGLKVPVKTSQWTEAKIRLATDEDNA